MPLTKEESIQLIKKLQDGKTNVQDERDLLDEIISRYKPHKIENYLFNQADLKDEFVWASWNALYRAKLNVGDPVSFATNRGRGAMLDYYRKVSSEKLLLVCVDCGFQMTYDRRNIKCRQCNCEELTSIEKEVVFPVRDFDMKFTYTDSFLYKIEMEDVFNELIMYIKTIEHIKYSDKNLAIQAINSREEWYNYARSTGKSHSWSIAFKQRMTSLLNPIKGQFLTA